MEVSTKRLPNVKYCSVGLLDDIFMALLQFLHFGEAGTADRARFTEGEWSDSRGGDGPRGLNGKGSTRAYMKAKSDIHEVNEAT